MATFPGIERPDQLPSPGAFESPTLDFKCKLDRRSDGSVDAFELAKDVASMASVYGGTLLIGACEEGRSGKLGVYRALATSEATAVVDAYQKAVRDRCRPVPMLSPVSVPYGEADRFVVAINVMPVLEGPVAVRVRGNADDGYGDDAFVFPVRLSTHAIMFTPEQLPMLMNPDLRRIAVLLRSIPERDATTRLHVRVRGSMPSAGAVPDTVEISAMDVRPEANVFTCACAGGRNKLWIPLSDVEAVWPERDDRWAIRVSGELHPTGQFAAYDYRSGRHR